MGADIDGEAGGDRSGWSVAVSADGSRVAVGAIFNSAVGDRAGHVRVFDWDGLAWVQVGADIGAEAAGDESGWSVALSADGSRVAIGAPRAFGDGSGREAGHVRVFDWDGLAWVQVGADIEGEATGDLSGWSISFSADGSRVAISATLNSGAGEDAGHVRVFDWSGSAWVQVGVDVDGEATGEGLGLSLALSADGSRMAISAQGNDRTGEATGPVRVLDWDGLAWVQVGADIDGEAPDDGSGRSVALSADGSRIAVGAPLNDGSGEAAGHVRLFDWDGLAWVLVGADIDGEATGDRSGHSVALSADGSRVAIGAILSDQGAGHVRVFEVALDE